MSTGTKVEEVRILVGYVLTKAVPGAAVFIATPYWVAQVGFAEYAIYSSGWAISLVVSGLFGSWISQALLRNTGDERKSYSIMPRMIVPATTLAAGIVAGGASLLLGSVIAGFTALVSLAVGVLASANVLTSIQSAVLQRHFMSGGVAWILSIKTVGAVALTIILINLLNDPDSLTLLLSFAVAAGASSVFASIRYRRLFVSNAETRSLSIVNEFWKYGWPMAIWATASSALLYSDRLALTLSIGSARAGEYAVVADIMVRGFSLVAFPITMYAHPLIMGKANKKDPTVISTIHRWLLIMMLLSGLFAGVASYAVYAGSEQLGIDSTLSLRSILLIALGAAAWQVALIAHKMMEVQDRTLEMAIILVVFAVACFLSNYLLAPTYGVEVSPVIFSAGAVGYCGLTYLLGIYRWRTSEKAN